MDMPNKIMFQGEIYERVDNSIDVKRVSALEKSIQKDLDMLRVCTRNHSLNKIVTKILNDFELFSNEFSKEFQGK